MELKDLHDAFKERDTETIKRLAAIEAKTDDLAKKADAIELAQFEMDQKMGRVSHHGGAKTGHGRSLGEEFVNSESFRALASMPEQNRKGHRADFIHKATITSLTTDAAGSAGAAVPVSFQPIDLLPHRRLTVRDLLPQVQITAGSVEIPVMKVSTNNAGMVAEAALKPESDLQLELKTFPARVIAHWMKASKQIIDDVPQMRDLIDTELLHGLGLKEEQQLLLGDNTGQNLHGMVPQATAFSAAYTMPAPNFIDVIGLALLQNANAEYPGDGVIMHPSDWMRIRMAKDADGNYIYGPPSEAVVPRIFGVPVVTTQAMTIDKFLVGQFKRAATIFDRWEARVEVGFVDDDFIRNLITLLGEERLAFAVRRPKALTYGDFSDAITAATAA
ncbi:phage major capsid protein [Rhizobium sp. Leaf386]|uniref:phage major capsid protein n=1 Tax=Rhizobium sp. Leaf386 TaxID=1736359 RepID=UPI0007144277|nr:phage major capsid protein [Rhizobium sp. Leaf386]KQT04141.1 hypothetical protein ASG50_18250 [Rhizobium sp. Leaf386]